MEYVIEFLKDNALDVLAPLSLPDEDTLVEIEEELLIHMPFDLREFLLNVSDAVYGFIEPVTVTDHQSHTYLPDVAAEAWNAFVPRHLIPICHDNDQYYCIDETGEITCWSDGGESGEIWSSIWSWAQEVWLGC
ncbi:MAG: SMI1/KNR4 family protein [Endozoicomonadaceae bacterium]|nr:SMI1/KNR4 family protein [Endozoicomonadaceae bacterium]